MLNLDKEISENNLEYIKIAILLWIWSTNTDYTNEHCFHIEKEKKKLLSAYFLVFV